MSHAPMLLKAQEACLGFKKKKARPQSPAFYDYFYPRRGISKCVELKRQRQVA